MSQERDSTGTAAEPATAAPPFRRQSASGVEQERRQAWGKEWGAAASKAAREVAKERS